MGNLSMLSASKRKADDSLTPSEDDLAADGEELSDAKSVADEADYLKEDPDFAFLHANDEENSRMQE